MENGRFLHHTNTDEHRRNGRFPRPPLLPCSPAQKRPFFVSFRVKKRHQMQDGATYSFIRSSVAHLACSL